MKEHGIVKGVVLVLVFIIIFVSLISVFRLIESALDEKENAEEDNPFSYGEKAVDSITWNGITYQPNKNIETLLVLGIDAISGADEKREDYKQADFIALIVMDKKAEEFRILHLNRDTMTEIPQTDVYGRTVGSYTAQLTLAHTYGSTDKARCRNTSAAVENLLYGVEIDHYLSLTMDAVAALNDSVGGVTVTLKDDFTYVDDSFVSGATVTLHGDQALSYVRARGELEDSSNLSRMDRQQQYIGALLEKYAELDSENTLETMMEVNEYLVSDCTIDQLSRMIERIGSYSYEGVYTIDGEAVVVDGFMEYHIDEISARETVVKLFYAEE